MIPVLNETAFMLSIIAFAVMFVVTSFGYKYQYPDANIITCHVVAFVSALIVGTAEFALLTIIANVHLLLAFLAIIFVAHVARKLGARRGRLRRLM